MKQRVPRRAWYSACSGSPGSGSAGAGSLRAGWLRASPARAVGRRPRVLVEDDHPALAISDFASFEQAGFDVAVCSGPGPDATSCPLLRGADCGIVASADAVLHGLDPALGIAAAIRQRYPAVAVVVERDGRAGEGAAQVPEGCVPLAFACSVPGQIGALWHALATRPRG